MSVADVGGEVVVAVVVVAKAKKATRARRTWKPKPGRPPLEKIAANPRVALGSPLPHARQHTLIRELLIVSEHNAYHIGELAILRQVMGTWPARR